MESLVQTSLLFAQRVEEVNDDMRRLAELRVSELDALYDDSVKIEDRLSILGDEITATLLSQDYRGGYPVLTSFSRFLQDFENDSGINLEVIAQKLRFKDAKKLILSEAMAKYVKIGIGDDGEIIVDQSSGYEAEKRAENEKQAENIGRIRLNKTDPKAVDGRLKIYSCLYALAGEKGSASYQAVQKEYEEKFGVSLNKAELKKYFGTGEAKSVLMMDCDGDIHVHIDTNMSGMMHLKFAKPYTDIVQHYEKAIKIANEMPDAASVVAERAQIKQDAHKQQRSQYKRLGSVSSQKKVTVPVEFPMDLDAPWTKSGAAAIIDDDVVPFAPRDVQPLQMGDNKMNGPPASGANNVPLPSAGSKNSLAPIATQPRSMTKKTHTARGQGVFSDEDDSDEEDPDQPYEAPQSMSQRVSHPPVIANVPPPPSAGPLYKVSVLANPADDTLDLDNLDATVVSGGGAPNLFRNHSEGSNGGPPNPFRDPSGSSGAMNGYKSGSESGASSAPFSSAPRAPAAQPQVAPIDRSARFAKQGNEKMAPQSSGDDGPFMGYTLPQQPATVPQMFKLAKPKMDVQPVKPVKRNVSPNPAYNQAMQQAQRAAPLNEQNPSRHFNEPPPQFPTTSKQQEQQQPQPAQGPFVSHQDQFIRRLPNVEQPKIPSEELLHACIYMFLAADKDLLYPIKEVAKEIGKYLRSRGFQIETRDIFYHISRELKSELYFTNNAYVSLPRPASDY